MLWGIQQQLYVSRQEWSYAQALTGPVVDFIGNRIQLRLTLVRQVSALVQVLTNQTVHAFVGTPLPGALRVTEDTAMPVALANTLCLAISLLWSYVMLWRLVTAMLSRTSCSWFRGYRAASLANVPTPNQGRLTFILLTHMNL